MIQWSMNVNHQLKRPVFLDVFRLSECSCSQPWMETPEILEVPISSE